MAKKIIAATYDAESGEVFQHFGRTESFKMYTVEDDKIVSSDVISGNGVFHEGLFGILQENKVNVLICGGMGGGAQVAAANAGIEVVPGVTGSADKAAEEYVAGTLAYDPEAQCDHEHDENCEHHH